MEARIPKLPFKEGNPRRDLCPVHQQKATLLEIRQMMLNSGTVSQVRTGSSATNGVPSTSPVPNFSETVSVRTASIPPAMVTQFLSYWELLSVNGDYELLMLVFKVPEDSLALSTSL